MSLHFVSTNALATLPAELQHADNTVAVRALDDVWRGLVEHGTRDEPRAIDLIGHSSRGHQFLRLGGTVVDLLDLGVRRFFEQLVGSGVLAVASVTSVRLLGCGTATTESGRRTLRTLAAVLRRPVYGTRKTLLRSHYDAHGLRPEFVAILLTDGHHQHEV